MRIFLFRESGINLYYGHVTILFHARYGLAAYHMSRSMTKPRKWLVHPAKTHQPRNPPSLISLQFVLFGVAEDPMLLHADSEDSDQTGLMPREICVFAGRTTFC